MCMSGFFCLLNFVVAITIMVWLFGASLPTSESERNIGMCIPCFFYFRISSSQSPCWGRNLVQPCTFQNRRGASGCVFYGFFLFEFRYENHYNSIAIWYILLNSRIAVEHRDRRATLRFVFNFVSDNTTMVWQFGAHGLTSKSQRGIGIRAKCFIFFIFSLRKSARWRDS